MKTRLSSERRLFDRVPVDGAAAVLELSYLGAVYAVQDLSHGGARLKGPRTPPRANFNILLYVSERYVEQEARRVWSSTSEDGSFGIAFEDSLECSDSEIDEMALKYQAYRAYDSAPGLHQNSASAIRCPPRVPRWLGGIFASLKHLDNTFSARLGELIQVPRWASHGEQF